jgi:hypothetical protein
MDAMNKKPDAADGDPNDVLRDHGIDDLKARLDEAFEVPPGDDPGNSDYDNADPGPGMGDGDETGQRFDEVPPNDGEAGETPPKPESSEHLLQYSFYQPKPEKLIPAKQFLCVNSKHHVRKYTSGTVAPGGFGKTFLIFSEALAYLTGKALLGIEPKEPVNVCIWCEDPIEELEARFAAAMKLHKITEQDFKARPVLMSARKDEMIVARELKGQTVIVKPVIDNVIQQMKTFDIGIKFIDPFIKTHALKENHNVAMDFAGRQWNRVAEETGAAIDLLFHTRKTGGEEITVEDNRGAGSMNFSMRSVRTLNRMSAKEALALGVEEDHWRHFRVGVGKTNVGPMSDRSEWYRIESIDLENGDNVGAVQRWKTPSPHEDVTYDQIREVQRAVAQKTYWASVQAEGWVGEAIAKVLGMNVADPAHKAKIKAMIAGWIKGGVLKPEDRRDENRKLRPAVVVGELFDEKL